MDGVDGLVRTVGVHLSEGEADALLGWLARRLGRSKALARGDGPLDRLEHVFAHWMDDAQRAHLEEWLARRIALGDSPVPAARPRWHPSGVLVPALRTPLCDLLGIRIPVLLAGMANGPTTPELVGAVSRAGGLGTFGVAGMSLEGVRAAVRRAAEIAGGAPVGVNVLVPPPLAADGDPERVRAVLAPLRRDLGLPEDPPPGAGPPPPPSELVAAGLEAGARVVSVGLGDPSPLVPLARAAGAPVVAMAATVEEAVRWAAAGADVVVAQGAEAGGHRSTAEVAPDGSVPLVGTMALVRQVVRRVDVPVVAAGGIMDGAGIAAALALGAQGAQLGTRFLVAREAGVPASWRTALRTARDTDPVIIRSVSGRPARGIRNRLTEALDDAAPGLGWPRQAAATGDLRRAAAEQDRGEMMALWAGQAAALAGDDQPAAEIVDALVAETRAEIARLAALLRG
ncbi:MAG: nitronate monooxygenase [Thermoleophilia bacterium]|nr:nitronate monooxygenase [Thermoleophilia bacterium]